MALPGMPRLVSAGPDGCPEIEEYAAAELAVLLGRATASGAQLIRDAVTVRHRHPRLRAGIRQGRVRVWLATQVARRCTKASLDAGQAMWVDEQTTPYLSTVPPERFLDLVDAKIIEADPSAAEERARARALARFVHAGRSDEDGLRTVVARASAGDVTYLVAVLDRLAGILAEGGDPRPHDVLRADALRILGNPARALALLTRATLDRSHADLESTEELSEEALFPHGKAGWMLDSTGQALPGTADLEQLTATGAAVGPAADMNPAGDARPESHADPGLLRALIDALGRFDAGRLGPVTVLHVHLSDTALAVPQGVARVEELGPVVIGELRDWLRHPFASHTLRQQVRVHPVLDADAVRPVDRYEWPAPMSQLATLRAPYEVFPWGTLRSRKADDDHVQPYRPRDRGGPPGQTRLNNNAKLSRLHHRLKTNGGWTLQHPQPGVYLWRTPHGHWFRLDGAGTHHIGRKADLDARRHEMPQAPDRRGQL